MDSLRNLSVRWKLLGLAGILVAFLVASGALGIVNIGSSAREGNHLYTDVVLPLGRLVNIEAAVGNADTDVLRTIGAGAQGSPYASAFKTDAATVAREMRAYQAGGLAGAEATAAQQFNSAWSQYVAAGQRSMALALKGRVQAANRAYFTKVSPINQRLDGALSQLVKINDVQAKAGVNAINSNKSSSTTLTIIVSRAIKRSADVVLDRLTSLRDHCATNLRAAIEAMAGGISPCTCRR